MRISGEQRKIVTYFNKTKVFNQGYLKFGMIAKKIKYCLGETTTTYKARKLFTQLLEVKYFNQKKNEKRSYLYQFVNKKLKKTDNEFRGVTITFD